MGVIKCATAGSPTALPGGRLGAPGEDAADGGEASRANQGARHQLEETAVERIWTLFELMPVNI